MSITSPPVEATVTPRRTRRRLVAAISVIAVVAGMVATVVSFQRASSSSAVSGDAELHDGIRVHADVVEVNPDQGHMVVRLSFEPIGSFAETVVRKHFLARPVRVTAVGGADVVDENFQAGELMEPQDVLVELGSGDIAEFPFDHYDSHFQVRAVTPTGVEVPSVMFGEASVHGYRITIRDPTAEPNGGNDFDLAVARGPATLVFSVFVMLLMWALTILTVTIAIAQIVGGHKIDWTLNSLIGVLLFAFPAIRDSVPNAPPLGVLSDMLSFFWCEMALGVALVALLITTMRRHEHHTGTD